MECDKLQLVRTYCNSAYLQMSALVSLGYILTCVFLTRASLRGACAYRETCWTCYFSWAKFSFSEAILCI